MTKERIYRVASEEHFRVIAVDSGGPGDLTAEVEAEIRPGGVIHVLDVRSYGALRPSGAPDTTDKAGH